MPLLFISIVIKLKTNLNKKKIEIMATRGTIVLKIKDEDLGKKVKVNPTYLTKDEERVKKYETKCFEVELSKKYAEIYQHWDSYPIGLGVDLVKHWDTYDKVLNLILGGDISSVRGDEVNGYVAMEDRDESYDSDKPRFTDGCPPVSEEYQYLFDEDSKWYVRGSYSVKEWTLASECIVKQSSSIE